MTQYPEAAKPFIPAAKARSEALCGISRGSALSI
jgi:hypothetical protein